MNISTLINYFNYGFIVRGFFIGLLVTIVAATLGHFMVLKKLSLIGHGLAHVSYFSVAISIVFFEQSIWINLIIATIASILIHYLVQNNKGYSDSIIGVFSAISIALGTLIIAANPNQNVSVEQFLFGSILLLRQIDVIAVIFISTIVFGFSTLFYHDLATLTFDQDYAKVVRLKTSTLNLVLAMLTAWLIIIGIRAAGTLMISSFIMFPTLIVMPLAHKFKGALFLGLLVAGLTFIIGFLTSLWFDWPTGSTIVLVYGIVWFLTMGYQLVSKRILGK